MGFDRKLSTAEVSAAVERAFARQEGREPKSIRTDNPVIGELASLDTLEYELQRGTAAAGLGIGVSALDKVVKGRRSATEDENAALPHWNVEPSAEPVDGAALLNNLRQVFRRYVVLPKGADIALPLWVLHAWTMDAGDISPLMVLMSPTKRCGKTSAAHRPVLPGAALRAFEQHNLVRAVSLHRRCEADASHRRGRQLREGQ